MSRKKLRRQQRVITAFGISYFSEAEFRLLKETAVDRDALDDTYEDWRKNVEGVKKTLRECGIRIVDVELTVAEIEAYCLEHGVENNGATRSQLVVVKAKALHRQD